VRARRRASSLTRASSVPRNTKICESVLATSLLGLESGSRQLADNGRNTSAPEDVMDDAWRLRWQDGSWDCICLTRRQFGASSLL
jgi:hypothetical protein